MTRSAIYRTALAPAWIDYNGHLRDAYYSLIVSLAADALMDRIGMNETYRIDTRCTLYTLEMHVHFLREVKQTEIVEVNVRVLATDRKRIHAAFDLRSELHPEPVATAEVMLLHVFQGEKPTSQPFPPHVAQAIEKIAAEVTAADGLGSSTPIPGSRRIELPRR
jgi:acyl-CoA thioester hydrolase